LRSNHQLIARQCSPPRLGDPQPRNFELLTARDDARGGRGRQPGAHKLDHLRNRETVCEHDRLGAAVAA
jgi:hypothetical protein